MFKLDLKYIFNIYTFNEFNRYFYTCILYKCREVKVMKLSRVRL